MKKVFRMTLTILAAAAVMAGLTGCGNPLSPTDGKVTHSVSFDRNSDTATGTMASQAIAEGESARLAANAFTREGYSFLGWSASSGATSAEYSDCASFGMGQADVRLYALWGIAAPTISASGSYRKTITIECANAGATIHYTLDGSTPTAASPVYLGTAGPVVAGHMVTRTVKAVAVNGQESSAVASLVVTSAVAASSPIAIPTGYSTLSGLSGTSAHVDGDKDTARYRNVRAGVSDGSFLYISDCYTIRKVDLATGGGGHPGRFVGHERIRRRRGRDRPFRRLHGHHLRRPVSLCGRFRQQPDQEGRSGHGLYEHLGRFRRLWDCQWRGDGRRLL